jgi:hypothetical protein
VLLFGLWVFVVVLCVCVVLLFCGKSCCLLLCYCVLGIRCVFCICTVVWLIVCEFILIIVNTTSLVTIETICTLYSLLLLCDF